MNDYNYLIESPEDEQKVFERIESLIQLANHLIETQQLTDYVQVNDDIIAIAVLDYFADIRRLKDFHNIEITRPVKVAAYTAFWILKRRPLQIIKKLDDSLLKSSESPLYINEWFAINILFAYSFKTDVVLALLPEKREPLDIFIDTLHYNLTYRLYTPQSLELTLIALMADSDCGVG